MWQLSYAKELISGLVAPRSCDLEANPCFLRADNSFLSPVAGPGLNLRRRVAVATPGRRPSASADLEGRQPRRELPRDEPERENKDNVDFWEIKEHPGVRVQPPEAQIKAPLNEASFTLSWSCRPEPAGPTKSTRAS